MIYAMPKAKAHDPSARDFSERLRAALQHAKMPLRGAQAALARRHGVKPPTVNAWLNGRHMPEPERVRLMAEDCGVLYDWLYFGRGPMTKVSTGKAVEQPNFARVAAAETNHAYVRFPLLEGFAGMGRGDYVGDYPEIVEFVEVTREWTAQKLRGIPPEAIRVITGRGDSMRGQYNDGDLVFVDARIKQFLGDSAYCYRWNGQVQIKRLQLVGKNIVRILSENPKYPPIDASLEEIEIGGRALAAWTLHEF